MGNEQKMRDAFEKWGTANTPERERLAFYDGWHAREALVGDQVELTDAKDAARYRWLKERMLAVDFDWGEQGITALSFEMPDGSAYGGDCDQNIDNAMAAAHEAKRASCSRAAKKSTHEGGRVDETGEIEHVGGAA